MLSFLFVHSLLCGTRPRKVPPLLAPHPVCPPSGLILILVIMLLFCPPLILVCSNSFFQSQHCPLPMRPAPVHFFFFCITNASAYGSQASLSKACSSCPLSSANAPSANPVLLLPAFPSGLYTLQVSSSCPYPSMTNCICSSLPFPKPP